jgi:hypothetical protein
MPQQWLDVMSEEFIESVGHIFTNSEEVVVIADVTA